MDPAGLLLEVYGRVPPLVAAVVDGLTVEELVAPPPGDEPGNSIAWLTWHLARVQDHHLAELVDKDQLWSAWATHFGRLADPHDTGYGHSAADAASVRPSTPEVLVAYQAAVHERTVGFLEVLDAEELDRVVDERWDPPVTLGVRLVSVVDDALQHLGQAAYLRGLLGR